MEFSGSKIIKAPQQKVFDALLDPGVLKESIPGCEQAQFVEYPHGKEIQLVISPNFPGFKGTYTLYVKPQDVVAPTHLVLATNPSSGIGSIKAHCTINLMNQADHTTLNYAAEAKLEGKIAATPELLIKPAVKGALDHFFKNLEKHM